ncbi:MAG: methyltransferase type 11, partial [Cyanobacteria bacterium J06649_5]
PEKCRRLMEFAGFKEITIRKQQLGQYRSLEQLIGWNGTWFHPQLNPLAQLSEQQLRAITADYSQWLKEQPATNEGLWCESLAYFVAGSKLS